MFRTIVDLRHVYPDVSQKTIAVAGTPNQIVIAEKLVSVLEQFQSSGDSPSSVVVYEPKASQSAPTSESKPATWFIKAHFRPTYSFEQMQSLIQRLHSDGRIARLSWSPSRHVIVVRGTSDEIETADRMIDK